MLLLSRPGKHWFARGSVLLTTSHLLLTSTDRARKINWFSSVCNGFLIVHVFSIGFLAFVAVLILMFWACGRGLCTMCGLQ